MLDSRTVTTSGFCFVAKRNCSMAPRQVCTCVGLVAMVSLVVAIGWASMGAWFVLPFAGGEIVALIVAVVVFGRHVGDRESIQGSRSQVVVEVTEADRTVRYEFVPQWSRLEMKGDRPGRRLALCAQGREVEVGRFLDERERTELVLELRRWIPIR